MPIRGNEKLKVQKSASDIASGHFDERDVDHVFMGLRAHAGSHLVFKEIAHYVAHNDLRDKGITNQSIEAFYLSFQYFMQYVSPRVPLDITSPFPMYIKKLMKFQVDKCNEPELRRRFNATKARLKSRIDNLFKDHPKTGTTRLSAGRFSHTTFAALQYILGFIGSHPAYTQEQIVGELIAVLKENDIAVDEVRFAQQSDKIMLCVLTLLHNTEYDFKGHKRGYCAVSCDKTALLFGVRFVDEEGADVSIEEAYGTLQIHGHVAVDSKGSDVTVSFPVVTSTLKVEDWCEQSMFSIEPAEVGDNKLLFRKVRFDGGLCVSENFKLERTVA